MKRVFPVVMITALITGATVSGYSKEKKNDLPQKVDFSLPSGEKLTASRVPDKGGVPNGVQVILKARVAEESAKGIGITGTHVVLRTETGQTYIAGNDPYVNTLRQDCLGKTVKVKGKTVTRTSFKGYPGLYIQDILEVK